MSRVDELQGAWCPLFSPQQVAVELGRGRMQISSIGLERRCSACKEYWPADTEFFYAAIGRSEGLSWWCKACYRDWKARHQAQRHARLQPTQLAA